MQRMPSTQYRELRYSKESVSILLGQRNVFRPYKVDSPTWWLAGLLLSLQGTQQGDPLGMLLFALAIQPLILRVQSKCDLELNLWYADDDTLARSIAKVAKAYQVLQEDRPKHCFPLVPQKSSLWWRTMDCVRLRLLLDSRLDIDDKAPRLRVSSLWSRHSAPTNL
jgi:hypothetical protein